MFLLAIRKADKGGFALSVRTDATATDTTIQSLPKWVYDEFSKVESLVKKYLGSIECSLVGYRVKQSKDETKAVFDIDARLGGIPTRSKFEVSGFVFQSLDFDSSSEEAKALRESRKIVNSLVARHTAFSELLQAEFSKLVMAESGQLELFE